MTSGAFRERLPLTHIGILSADPHSRRHCAVYTKIIRIIDRVFVKSFFIAKILCTYTMNYLRQEKGLRDHQGDPEFAGRDRPFWGFYPNWWRG
jgi:hypothetical protein